MAACVPSLLSPESISAGPLALVPRGDVIELDVSGRRLNVALGDDELAPGAGAGWTPRPPAALHTARYECAYDSIASSLDRLSDFDFLAGTAPVTDRRSTAWQRFAAEPLQTRARRRHAANRFVDYPRAPGGAEVAAGPSRTGCARLEAVAQLVCPHRTLTCAADRGRHGPSRGTRCLNEPDPVRAFSRSARDPCLLSVRSKAADEGAPRRGGDAVSALPASAALSFTTRATAMAGARLASARAKSACSSNARRARAVGPHPGDRLWGG